MRFFTHGVLDEVAPRLSVVVDGKRIQVDCPRGDDPLPTPVLSGDVEKDRKPQEVFWTFSLRATNTCDECKHGVRIGVESALMGEEESPGMAPRKVLPLPEMKKVKERFRLPSLSCEGDGLDGCQIVWKTPDGRERRMVAGSVVTLPQECVHQAIRIIVRKRGFEDWVSPPVSLCYGQRRVIGVQASDRPLAAEPPAEPPVAAPEPDDGNSLLWCGQRWETGGRPSVPDEDVRWKPDADGFLQSGGGGAGDAVSWAKMTAVGPCRLVFRCKVQTYYGDFLVTCDGAPLYHYQDASGVDVPWRNASFDIPAGSHEIGFSYHHPGRGYANKMNGVLLDGVKVVPLVP